jgi:hypothetical protein
MNRQPVEIGINWLLFLQQFRQADPHDVHFFLVFLPKARQLHIIILTNNLPSQSVVDGLQVRSIQLQPHRQGYTLCLQVHKRVFP